MATFPLAGCLPSLPQPLSARTQRKIPGSIYKTHTLPSCLLPLSRIKQALKLLTFRLVIPFVYSFMEASKTGTGTERAVQQLPRPAQVSVILKNAIVPRNTLLAFLKCQSQRYSDPLLSELESLPNQEQEEGWEPFKHQKLTEKTTEACFLTSVIFLCQSPNCKGWIPQQLTNSCFPANF